MKIYSDPRLLSLGVIHGTPDRGAGNMRLAENTRALFEALGVPESRILRFKQTHSDTLIPVTSAEEAQALQNRPLQEADGWLLAGRGYGAAILTADCVPLIIWDETANIVGLSHCGWRGVAAGLPGKTARAIRQYGGKGPLSAWAGPHIQSCCFEVQQDVADKFPGCVLHKNGKLYVDLNKEIVRQLTAAGLKEENIRLPYYCTCGDKENFFSYRRDHTKDALMTFVYKP